MNFDMNTCWSRAVELLQSNFQLLLALAGMFLLLPTMAIYLLVPDFQMLSDPSIDQSVLQDRIGEILVPILSISLVASLFQFGGQGAMIALMGDGRPTVGQAIGSGFKAVPGLVVVMIAFALLFTIGALLISVPISLLAGVTGAPALGLIAILPMMIFMIWLMARLSMTMPVMVLSGNFNPITAMVESFRLTGPKQWPIAGFWTVIYAIFTIVSLLFSGMASMVAAIAGAGTAALVITGLANGVTGGVTGMVVCAVAAAMHAQLSGPSDAALADTFE